MLKLDKNNLVWIDLEMTGLNPETDHILEIATIVTDSMLEYQVEGPSLVIHQPDDVLDRMNDWCIKQHGESGLTQRVRDSNISLLEAEQQTLAFIQQYVPNNNSPLCGNSIHQDRKFLIKYMPMLESFFHYRNIDVSTIKELSNRWKPRLADQFQKKASHLALDDIRDSIAELQYYKRHWLD